MRVVMGTPFEFLRIVEGHGLLMRTSDGEDVLVRLYTAKECMDVNRAAIETSGSNLHPVTLSEAEALVKPYKF